VPIGIPNYYIGVPELMPNPKQAITLGPAISVPSANGKQALSEASDEWTLRILRQGQEPVSGEALEASLGHAFIPESSAGTFKDVIHMDEARSFFLFLIYGQGTCE
jgi:hypothetical protein